MLKYRLLCILFCTLWLAARAAAQSPRGPVKVFILAGQSNMEGQAVVDLDGRDYNDGKGTLLKLFDNPEKAQRLKHLRDSSGHWTARDDVFVSYRREGRPILRGPLSIGFTVYGDRHHFGPELQFGHVVGEAFEDPILIIKTAWGGKSLYRDFRPPSAGGKVGTYYRKMIEDVRETLDNLATDFPMLAERTVQLAAFVWYHGWNDGVDPEMAVPEYESNLVHLIHDVRKDLNVPDLPVIVGELTGPWVDAPPQWERLRMAQKRAASDSSFGGSVLFVPTRDFVRQPDESPNPTHGHHEFGNAETYFLVGEALGHGYLELQRQASSAIKLTLNSPRDYQVIQRTSRRSASVVIRGETDRELPADAVFEVNYEQPDTVPENQRSAWVRLPVDRQDGHFRGALEIPEGGWYRLRVRVRSEENVLAESTLLRFGVGEVLIVAGQSNSANHGEGRTFSQTGMVAMHAGQDWRLAKDPIPGASGNGGSFLPHFGDRIAERLNVPVGLIARGIGATSVREWLPPGIRFPNPPTLESRVQRMEDGRWEADGRAYQTLRTIVKELGPQGFRAILWHQGESDANQRDASRTLPGNLYSEYLTKLIEGIRSDANWHVPWFVAQASYHTPEDPGSDEIREAQLAVVRSGVALQGPDTDQLQGDYRDQEGRGVHFSEKGLRAHGDLWSDKVLPWIDSEMQQAGSSFKVGVDRINITPSYPIRLSGFAFRKHESEGVSQPIWARALAISHAEEHPVVIVTIDNLGIRFVDVERVAQRLSDELRLPRENFVVTFTHTHSAPKLSGSADNIFAEPIPTDQQKRIDEYTEFVLESILTASRNAVSNRVSATLHWAVGNVGFAINRRTPGGPVDHSLPVLVARTTDEDQRIVAVYATYACHCVTLSQNQINGDWAGYAVEAIERLVPGAVGFVSIGCGSDQNPESGVTGDKIDIARQQGMEIGDEVMRLIQEGSLREITAKPKATLRVIKLPFDGVPDEETLQETVRQGGPAGYNAETQLNKIQRGETLPDGLLYPVQCFSFGDQLAMLFLAGEVCVDYAHRIRNEFRSDRLWLHGYSNDFGAYIPSERMLNEGGYGAGAEIPYFALPSPLKSGIEQLIIDEVTAILPPSLAIPPGTRGISAKSPEDSLRSIVVAPEYEVQLVASEPQISDPVAIDFGADGKLWVCQMTDYGHGVHEAFEPHGEIRLLVDEDGDGFYESSKVFLDGLRYPTDVKCWRDGILVCDAPNIIFAKDTDADGVADVSQVLCSGFSTENGQARVNSLRWGLDGWLYGSGGLFGGLVRYEGREEIDVRRRDFRMQPDERRLEPVTGRSQQGRVRNDWGDWFGCDNGTMIRHYPVIEGYALRNPHVTPPSTAVFVPSGKNVDQLFPAQSLVLFPLSGAPGKPTSACGLTIYRDNLLGEDFYGNSFTCEPVNQLVYRQSLQNAGNTYVGSRVEAETDRDFLVSTDQWFRPVQARTGPDGGLYIVDMYRFVIEHPMWIPEEVLAELNVFAGQGMGRIYRVIPKHSAPREIKDLTALTSSQLCNELNTPNGTVRDIVHQLLIWRHDLEDFTPLVNVFRQSSLPAVRIQALSILDQLNGLDEKQLLTALSDMDPEVRRHALRLSESRLESHPAIYRKAIELKSDSDLRVRTQLAYSLGHSRSKHQQKTNVLALVDLVHPNDDAYAAAAVLSSVHRDNMMELFELGVKRAALRSWLLEPLLDTIAAEGSGEHINEVLMEMLLGDEPFATWRLDTLAKFLQNLNLRADFDSIELSEDVAKRAVGLRRRLADGVANIEVGVQQGVSIVRLMGQCQGRFSQRIFGGGPDNSTEVLAALVDASRPVDIQKAAITALFEIGDLNGIKKLIQSVRQTTPVVRKQVIDELVLRPSLGEILVNAIQTKTLMVGEFDTTTREQLFQRIAPELRSQLESAFKMSVSSDRQQLIEQWSVVNSIVGVPGKGRGVFVKNCSQCHRLEEIGHAVGPDLAALTVRSSEALLRSIMDPNREVDSRYQSYVLVTEDGRSYSGQLKNETGTAITLLQQEGKELTIARNRIEQLNATGQSLMPVGLEQNLSKQDMADLIAYLQQFGPPAKRFPGNEPRVVRRGDSGSWSLGADTAAIFGDQIVFESESPFRNIGYWHGHRDYVSWTIDVPSAVRVDVWIDYACDPTAAGNPLQIETGPDTIRWRVEGTSGWADYRQVLVGQFDLQPGENRITVRASSVLTTPALLDLRTIALVRPGDTPGFIETTQQYD